MPMTGYFVRFRFYGVNNTMTFYKSYALYNWQDVMREEFGKNFEVVGIYEFDY